MTRKLVLTFIAMGIGVLVVAVDIASINVAIPAVEKSFSTDIGMIEWVVNGYGLTLTEERKADILNFMLGSGSRQTLIDDFGQTAFRDIYPHIQHAYITGLKFGLCFAVLVVASGAVLALFVRE